MHLTYWHSFEETDKISQSWVFFQLGRQVEAILYDKIIGKKITTAMREHQENVKEC